MSSTVFLLVLMIPAGLIAIVADHELERLRRMDSPVENIILTITLAGSVGYIAFAVWLLVTRTPVL